MEHDGSDTKYFEMDIPGMGPLALERLLLDVNGTIAVDGKLLPGVTERLKKISRSLTIHLITADTYGAASRWMGPWEMMVLHPDKGSEEEQKERAVIAMGATRTAAIGNGMNDVSLLTQAALGICVVGREGAARAAMTAADIVIGDICDALDLFLHPFRLVATLRR